MNSISDNLNLVACLAKDASTRSSSIHPHDRTIVLSDIARMKSILDSVVVAIRNEEIKQDGG